MKHIRCKGYIIIFIILLLIKISNSYRLSIDSNNINDSSSTTPITTPSLHNKGNGADRYPWTIFGVMCVAVPIFIIFQLFEKLTRHIMRIEGVNLDSLFRRTYKELSIFAFVALFVDIMLGCGFISSLIKFIEPIIKSTESVFTNKTDNWHEDIMKSFASLHIAIFVAALIYIVTLGTQLMSLRKHTRDWQFNERISPTQLMILVTARNKMRYWDKRWAEITLKFWGRRQRFLYSQCPLLNSIGNPERFNFSLYLLFNQVKLLEEVMEVTLVSWVLVLSSALLVITIVCLSPLKYGLRIVVMFAPITAICACCLRLNLRKKLQMLTPSVDDVDKHIIEALVGVKDDSHKHSTVLVAADTNTPNFSTGVIISSCQLETADFLVKTPNPSEHSKLLGGGILGSSGGILKRPSIWVGNPVKSMMLNNNRPRISIFFRPDQVDLPPTPSGCSKDKKRLSGIIWDGSDVQLLTNNPSSSPCFSEVEIDLRQVSTARGSVASLYSIKDAPLGTRCEVPGIERSVSHYSNEEPPPPPPEQPRPPTIPEDFVAFWEGCPLVPPYLQDTSPVMLFGSRLRNAQENLYRGGKRGIQFITILLRQLMLTQGALLACLVFHFAINNTHTWTDVLKRNWMAYLLILTFVSLTLFWFIPDGIRYHGMVQSLEFLANPLAVKRVADHSIATSNAKLHRLILRLSAHVLGSLSERQRLLVLRAILSSFNRKPIQTQATITSCFNCVSVSRYSLAKHKKKKTKHKEPEDIENMEPQVTSYHPFSESRTQGGGGQSHSAVTNPTELVVSRDVGLAVASAAHRHEDVSLLKERVYCALIATKLESDCLFTLDEFVVFIMHVSESSHKEMLDSATYAMLKTELWKVLDPHDTGLVDPLMLIDAFKETTVTPTLREAALMVRDMSKTVDMSSNENNSPSKKITATFRQFSAWFDDLDKKGPSYAALAKELI
eukprot:GHVR01109391.1.p1 GENE.GHVR01109391.1~~GHVR01109391.1.p1  ORF type:complete len:950 (-),score=177.89 GHVR01109391.1:31-2880(-)